MTRLSSVIEVPGYNWHSFGTAFCYWNGDLYVTEGHHPDIADYFVEHGATYDQLEQATADGTILFGWIDALGEINWMSGNYRPNMRETTLKDEATAAAEAYRDENSPKVTESATFNDFWPENGRKSNIFDPIEDKLDQRVFDGEEPEKRVKNFVKRLYLKEFAREFPDLDPNELIKLYITGSLTTYQYSDTSDMDISVFPDYSAFEKAGIDPKEARKRLISMSIDHVDGTFLPGGVHPLQFFVVPEGINPEDLYKPGLRSAYNLQENEWIVPPERSRTHDIKREMPEMYQRASAMADKMTQALDNDPETARAMWLQVHQKRQLDQRAGLGDFSEGNIVYKFLLNQGLFDRIRTELGEYIASLTTISDNKWTLNAINAQLNQVKVKYVPLSAEFEQPGIGWLYDPAQKTIFYTTNAMHHDLAIAAIGTDREDITFGDIDGMRKGINVYQYSAELPGDDYNDVMAALADIKDEVDEYGRPE
jgi:hypothetical protein